MAKFKCVAPRWRMNIVISRNLINIIKNMKLIGVQAQARYLRGIDLAPTPQCWSTELFIIFRCAAAFRDPVPTNRRQITITCLVNIGVACAVYEKSLNPCGHSRSEQQLQISIQISVLQTDRKLFTIGTIRGHLVIDVKWFQTLL